MSLLWRDQVRIGLTPDRLVVASRQRGLRPAAPRRQIIPVEAPQDAASWQAAVDAVPGALAHAGAGAGVTVVLSNHFVRYALLPWTPSLKSDDEWLALARHRLELVHGHSTEDWIVRCAETAPRAARIACGVDRALLETLERRIAEHGATLTSVQPYLMAAFNHIREGFGGESGWVVIQEPGRLTLALILDGAWAAIRSRRADERWRALLPDILEREGAVLALERPCTRVLVYTQEAFETGFDGSFNLEAVPGTPAPGADEREFAMVQG